MSHSKEYELGYKDALCDVRFKYLKECNGEQYTRGYNAGRMYVMRQFDLVSDDFYDPEPNYRRVE